MFSLASYATLALSAVSAVSGFVVPRAEPPAGWATDYLESYTVYHTRYLALGCNNQHGKPFFDQCCHPLLATESLETARPAQCIPSVSASSSAARAEPTSTINPPVDDGDDDDDEDCEDDDGDDSLASSFSQGPAPQPTTSQAPPPPPITSQEPAPQPTTTEAPKPTTEAPAPKPTTEAPAPKPTTEAPAPPPENKAPPPSSDVITGGDATFFFQNGVAGACGTVHSDADLIAAIDSRRYGNTGVKSGLCGKQVRITNPANNKSVTVTIADACPTCNNENSIDLSRAAFQAIASFDQGLVGITWSFV